MVIHAYSDSSFSPESEESHGSFVIMADEAPLFWRSGRQSLITVSTAESELAELTEAMTAGESVSVLFEELYEKVRKVAWCDNQAAITILVSEGGSWRTRHLRMRAAFARQAVMRGEWQIAHQPGEKMIADIGTKALPSTRLSVLKELMGMRNVPDEAEEEGRREKEGKEDVEEKKEGGEDLRMRKAMAVKIIILVAQMSMTKASKEEVEKQKLKEEERAEEEFAFHMMVFLYTAAVVVFTILVQRMWKVGVRWMGEDPRKSSCSETRSLPADSDQEEEFEDLQEDTKKENPVEQREERSFRRRRNREINVELRVNNYVSSCIRSYSRANGESRRSADIFNWWWSSEPSKPTCCDDWLSSDGDEVWESLPYYEELLLSEGSLDWNGSRASLVPELQQLGSTVWTPTLSRSECESRRNKSSFPYEPEVSSI